MGRLGVCDDLSFPVQANQADKRHESLNGARADSNAVGSADNYLLRHPEKHRTYHSYSIDRARKLLEGVETANQAGKVGLLLRQTHVICPLRASHVGPESWLACAQGDRSNEFQVF